ncbi:MAG: inositol monophosphatase family protein [Thermoanaerobaculia bacterium]
MTWAAELRVAREAAASGGQAALGYFRQTIDVRRKGDASPVTDADVASETAIIRTIERAFPSDGFLGEESGERPSTNGRRWIIDPIDGTRAFLRGLPHWGVLIGLEVDGHIEAGVAHFPAIAVAYSAATSEGCWRNDERIYCRNDVSLDEATVQIGEFRTVRDGNPSMFDAVVRTADVVRSYGDAYAPCLVLDGRSDAWIEAAVKPWDLAPFPVLAREAGALFTDWNGRESITSGNALLAPAPLHARILSLMA